jgi:hypothetical protein
MAGLRTRDKSPNEPLLSDLLLKSCDVSTLALTATLLVLPDALEMLRLCSVVSD